MFQAASVGTKQCSQDWDGSVIPDQHNNQLYNMCEDGYWKVLECPVGMSLDLIKKMCYVSI